MPMSASKVAAMFLVFTVLTATLSPRAELGEEPDGPQAKRPLTMIGPKVVGWFDVREAGSGSDELHLGKNPTRAGFYKMIGLMPREGAQVLLKHNKSELNALYVDIPNVLKEYHSRDAAALGAYLWLDRLQVVNRHIHDQGQVISFSTARSRVTKYAAAFMAAPPFKTCTVHQDIYAVHMRPSDLFAHIYDEGCFRTKVSTGASSIIRGSAGLHSGRSFDLQRLPDDVLALVFSKTRHYLVFCHQTCQRFSRLTTSKCLSPIMGYGRYFVNMYERRARHEVRARLTWLVRNDPAESRRPFSDRTDIIRDVFACLDDPIFIASWYSDEYERLKEYGELERMVYDLFGNPDDPQLVGYLWSIWAQFWSSSAQGTPMFKVIRRYARENPKLFRDHKVPGSDAVDAWRSFLGFTDQLYN